MRPYQSLFLILVLVLSEFGQGPKPVAERVAVQNTLFDEQYESDLRNMPERATAFGDYRYNDKLEDHSLEAIFQRHKTDQMFLARLEDIQTTGFSDHYQLSHDLLVRVLQQRIADFDLKEYEMPINQQNGIHTGLADLPLSVPLDSVKHYEDYIARLHQIPRALNQTTEVLRAGMKDKLMPVRFLIEKIPVQCQGIIDADPFLLPAKKYPADISPEEQKRLTQQITEAINTDVVPAYHGFADFVRTEYAPAGRTTLAITSLPDGEKRYQNNIYARTTTHMTADEIHPLGLREKTRLSRPLLLSRISENQSEIYSDFSGTDPRRFPALHRSNGAEAVRAFHFASQITGNGGSHPAVPVCRRNSLRYRNTGRQTTRPRRGRHIELRRTLAYRRRGDRLPRRRSRAPHAALRPATTYWPAEVPPSWVWLQCVHRRLGSVCGATWQGGRLLSRSGLGLWPSLF